MFLEKIDSQSDIKELSIKELEVLCQEVRQFLIDTVTETGGHLASNLGVVELTVAMLYVFDENDKIIWDVGHQSYTHKILTGRRNRFESLRQKGGISGFPKPNEHSADSFATGHASNSISVGEGFCAARKLLDEKYNVVSVIGDGALTGGMAYEALNNIGKNKMLVILNDNDMSIANNVGSVSLSLSKMRLSEKFNSFRFSVKKVLSKIPLIGKPTVAFCSALVGFLKSLLGINKLFDSFHMHYIGPFNGHKIEKLVTILTAIKKELEKENHLTVFKPVLLHVITKKGKGCPRAESKPEIYHSITPPGTISKSFANSLGNKLTALAQTTPELAVVCAAMPHGTGLTNFAIRFPERYFDVGIAEEHAVSFAAGMAKQGLKPFVAIYSTFLQRAYDQIMLDVCAQNLPVVFCIDRAGFVGSDGETHQGLFDLSYLLPMPNLTILAPKDTVEFEHMLEWASRHNSPVAIRYPKSCRDNFDTFKDILFGDWEIVSDKKGDITIFAAGNLMLRNAIEISKKSSRKINVVNARFIKPLDTKTLERFVNDKRWIVMEENMKTGGLGSEICRYAAEKQGCPAIAVFGVDDMFVKQGTVGEQLADCKMTVTDILSYINSVE